MNRFPSSKKTFVVQFQTITPIPYDTDFQRSCSFSKREKKTYRKGYTLPVYSTALNLKQILGIVLHSIEAKSSPHPSTLNITVYDPLPQHSPLWVLLYTWIVCWAYKTFGCVPSPNIFGKTITCYL